MNNNQYKHTGIVMTLDRCFIKECLCFVVWRLYSSEFTIEKILSQRHMYKEFFVDAYAGEKCYT